MIIGKAFRLVTSWLGDEPEPIAADTPEEAPPAPPVSARELESLNDAIYALSRDLADTLELIRQLRQEISFESEAASHRLAA